jgi:hypothetical protein
MPCRWVVRRTTRPDPDGQRRWDRAYLEVLAWTEEPAGAPADGSRGLGVREGGHESGALCPRVDTAPGAGPNGRAAAGAPQRPRAAARLGRALHRGLKGRYRPMRGFKCPRSTARFCRGHDELRNFLRPRSRPNQHVPAARRRLQLLRHTVTVLGILEAA